MEHFYDLFMTFPGVTCKLKHQIPFFYRNSWVAYLNPIKKNGVELAFIYGNELSDEFGILKAKGRKQVRGIELFSLKEIDDSVIIAIFQEALLLNEDKKMKKNK